ncbi:hypothetical protein EA58_10390 [Photobacterium galatheae]|uniref:Uncharacterized protein n=1 Tax=Photobacterium galatheae TaxID=1654360 RepID=A0A066RVJ5_9GAMM|nr:hypothetical protein EA58_10390 [Photobacterium galatheae]
MTLIPSEPDEMLFFISVRRRKSSSRSDGASALSGMFDADDRIHYFLCLSEPKLFFNGCLFVLKM